MISAELATRVAEAYEMTRTVDTDWHWRELSDVERGRFLAVAEAIQRTERARHKADLQALAACVDDALKGCE